MCQRSSAMCSQSKGEINLRERVAFWVDRHVDPKDTRKMIHSFILVVFLYFHVEVHPYFHMDAIQVPLEIKQHLTVEHRHYLMSMGVSV